MFRLCRSRPSSLVGPQREYFIADPGTKSTLGGTAAFAEPATCGDQSRPQRMGRRRKRTARRLRVVARLRLRGHRRDAVRYDAAGVVVRALRDGPGGVGHRDDDHRTVATFSGAGAGLDADRRVGRGLLLRFGDDAAVRAALSGHDRTARRIRWRQPRDKRPAVAFLACRIARLDARLRTFTASGPRRSGDATPRAHNRDRHDGRLRSLYAGGDLA